MTEEKKDPVIPSSELAPVEQNPPPLDWCPSYVSKDFLEYFSKKDPIDPDYWELSNPENPLHDDFYPRQKK
jgi:hypothetical protein